MAVQAINVVRFSVTILVALSGEAVKAASNAVEVGHKIVTTKCASCHAVGSTGTSPLNAAPRFRDLHLRYDVEVLSEALVEGIMTAHPAMPQFVFSAGDAGAIIAYLKSLDQ
ncbi:cytochrome c [Rhizobium sp. PL01]|uniref:c-type cytochrome n=1 Tax=Rhizobium sp. PL01 TaxID=3085631 RepID=UPI0029819840|nr:cytochrome c [Rhizobium sp. PL01]MDW5317486.1 cytochrome c [Rhizobium sp. PL01]